MSRLQKIPTSVSSAAALALSLISARDSSSWCLSVCSIPLLSAASLSALSSAIASATFTVSSVASLRAASNCQAKHNTYQVQPAQGPHLEDSIFEDCRQRLFKRRFLRRMKDCQLCHFPASCFELSSQAQHVQRAQGPHLRRLQPESFQEAGKLLWKQRMAVP